MYTSSRVWLNGLLDYSPQGWSVELLACYKYGYFLEEEIGPGRKNIYTTMYILGRACIIICGRAMRITNGTLSRRGKRTFFLLQNIMYVSFHLQNYHFVADYHIGIKMLSSEFEIFCSLLTNFCWIFLIAENFAKHLNLFKLLWKVRVISPKAALYHESKKAISIVFDHNIQIYRHLKNNH